MSISGFRRVFAAGAASVILSLGFASTAMAASNGAVGTFTISDHGQGCWVGGSLFADGSAGGGGNCSFTMPSGQEVIKISPLSWSFTDSTDTAVLLCASFAVVKGVPLPGLSGLQCVPVPVGTGAPLNLPYLSPDTYGKVTLS